MLRGPDGSLLLSGSPLLIPRQVQPAIRQQVDVEQTAFVALGGQAGGDRPPPQAKQHTTMIQCTSAELRDLRKQVPPKARETSGAAASGVG